jgi:UrcA family protein
LGFSQAYHRNQGRGVTHQTLKKEFAMKTIITLLAPAAIFTLSASAAQAQPETEVTAVSVAYHDLDLSKPEGIKRLNGRIARAAVKACGGAPDTLRLGQNQRFETCRKTAISKAMAAVASRMSPEMAAR